MAKDDRKNLRKTFDKNADLYDKIRSGYPQELFDDLASLGSLRSGSTFLEIGCGTGQATRSLVARGYDITCLELGEHLAEIARHHFEKDPNVKVVNTAFETWESQGALFDMIFAATSWHWLDPHSRFVKAAKLLKPSGKLAIVSGDDAFPEGFDPFFTEMHGFYRSIGEAYGKWPPPKPADVPDESAEFKRSRLFENVLVRRYLWEVRYTAEEYIDFLKTHSSHAVMDPVKREKVFSEIRRLVASRPSGSILKHYSAILHVGSLKS
jgi:SAM-dependent methyltransferase